MVKSNTKTYSSSTSAVSASGSSYSSRPYSYLKSSSVNPLAVYAILFIAIVSLGLSIYSSAGVSGMKKILNPAVIKGEDITKKATAHSELSAYSNTAPLNIVQITSSNLVTLQSQIQGLDTSYIGKFLIQYPDRIVVYDFEKDSIDAQISIQQSQIPEDFFNKLYSHPEIKQLSGETPVGGILDQNSLNTLKQQMPEVYKDAKVGDALLRYTTALVIYDYNNDKVVNAVALNPEQK